MDERRIEIIYHLLFFAYFFGDSDLLQSGGGGRPRIFTIVIIYLDICCKRSLNKNIHGISRQLFI